MFDQEILASQVRADRFPFPHEGDITLAVRNTNYALGPVMLQLAMQPGSLIPAHVHEGVAQVLFVSEGDFINEGKQHPPGTSLHVKNGQQHGSHTSEKAARSSCSGRRTQRRRPTWPISPTPKPPRPVRPAAKLAGRRAPKAFQIIEAGTRPV
jgi:hypothetical protein